jgi:hypothetical protein
LPWLVPAPLGIVRFSVTVPSFDQIDIALRRLDALLGLPLEAVQHIDDCLEMRGVDGPVVSPSKSSINSTTPPPRPLRIFADGGCGPVWARWSPHTRQYE